MKSKFFLLYVVCGMMMVSCIDNTSDYAVTKKVIDLTAYPKEWQFDSAQMQFYCHFRMPEITPYVYNYGQWSVYSEVDRKTKNPYQVLLPMSHYYSYIPEEPVTIYYTQHIDYRIGVGYVEIQLTNSDHIYGQQRPGEMIFRLQTDEEVIYLEATQNGWQYDEIDKLYYAHFDVPAITEDVYNYGQFSICREFGYGTEEAYQVPLPMSLFLSEDIPANTPLYFTQFIDYRMGVGYMEVQQTYSDFIYESEGGKPIPPDTMNFRVVLTY